MNNNYKYINTKQLLLEDIGKTKIGIRLPNRNELAKTYGVSRITIERAISELVGEGILISKDGSGTYVASLPISPMEGKKSLVCTNNGNNPLWALLICNVMYDTTPLILHGVEEVAQKYGYNIIMNLTNNLISKQEECLNDLLKSDICGIIIVPAILGDIRIDCFKEFAKRNIPIISVARQISGFITPCVQCNSFEAGMLGTEHLIEHGCRRIAYISSYAYSTSIDRYQGYVSALNRAGIDIDYNLVYFDQTLNEQNPGQHGIRALLSGDIDFDGIYAYNDRVAYRVYQAMSEKGLILGKDISLVTCDDTEICTMLPHKFTSIRQPVYEMSYRAASLLHDICSGLMVEDSYMEIYGNELIIRDSCGCNRQGDYRRKEDKMTDVCERSDESSVGS